MSRSLKYLDRNFDEEWLWLCDSFVIFIYQMKIHESFRVKFLTRFWKSICPEYLKDDNQKSFIVMFYLILLFFCFFYWRYWGRKKYKNEAH